MIDRRVHPLLYTWKLENIVAIAFPFVSGVFSNPDVMVASKSTVFSVGAQSPVKLAQPHRFRRARLRIDNIASPLARDGAHFHQTQSANATPQYCRIR